MRYLRKISGVIFLFIVVFMVVAMFQYQADQNSGIILNETVAGAGETLVIGMSGSNLADIVCCLLIVISAIILFVLALIRWCTRQQSRGGIFLGLFGLTAGVYCFVGTDTVNLFLDMQGVRVLQEYLMLLMPLFLTLYFERNLGSMFPRRFAWLLCIVCFNALIQIILELLGIQNLIVMADVSTMVLGVVCVVTIVSLIQLVCKSRRYQILIPIISVSVLLAGEVAKVILNHFSMYAYAEVATLYAMAIFGLLLAILHVLRISKEYRMDAEERVKAAEKQNSQLALAKLEADSARHDALAANEAKGKFLARMSHEIRTPINVVLGMDEMILRESKEQNVREYAMDIRTAGQSLLSLINDILDFSKIDSGKMEIVPVVYEISSMIHDLVNMTFQRAKGKGLQLVVEVAPETPSCLYGDDVRIRQVLINILTNAVKYTEEGTVWLRVRSRVGGEKVVLCFEVEDTGIGIKAEDLPKLAAEFERIEVDRNRHIEGTGLGMSITMQLLALMDSQLQIESEYGKGSKFYFELEQKIVDGTPIGDFESKVRQMAENFSYESSFFAPDAKLLVVDDNAVNRKVLRNLLKETQIQVSEADGGAECLRLVQENHYDLIFLDHMMPEMDGIETLHELRKLSDSPNQDTPVIILTANALSGAKEGYLKEGFADFLTKPIDGDLLEFTVRKYLPQVLVREVKTDEPEKKDSAANTDHESYLQYGISIENGLLLAKNDEEMYLELLRIFLRDRSKQDEMRKFISERNLKDYAIWAHGLKGNARTLGADKLADMALEHEKQSKAGNMEYAAVHWEELLSVWNKTLEGFQKFINQYGKNETEKYSVADSGEVLLLTENDLAKAVAFLEDFETGKAVDLLKTWIAGPLEPSMHERIKNALIAIEDEFDEDKAIELLKRN